MVRHWHFVIRRDMFISIKKIRIEWLKNVILKRINIQVFRDEGAILSLSWADPKYGNIIGLGTYSNKVRVYQEQLQGWKEIAFN